jgi:hypothetical protein
MFHKKCEDCGLKHASCGVPGGAKTRARWCSGCAKGHQGAVNTLNNKCEDCQLKHASCGVPGEGKKARWCAGCAKGHPGAVNPHAPGARRR